MSLDQVTNIAEIAAALATVITLAYLAIQIRSNNNLQKAESRRSVLNHSAQLATAIGQSSEASDVFYRGLTAYCDLKILRSYSSSLCSPFLRVIVAWRSRTGSWDSVTRIPSTLRVEIFTECGKPLSIEYWKRHGPTSEKDFFKHKNENVYNSQQPTYRKVELPPGKSSERDVDSGAPP